MPDEITLQQVLKDLKRASQEPSTPSWMTAVLSTVTVLLSGMNEQLRQLLQTVQQLKDALQASQEENERLRKQLYGKKSEKKPRKKTSMPRKRKTPPKPRGAGALDKANLAEEHENHELSESEKVCPVCGRRDLVRLPSTQDSIEYRYEPARLIRVHHHRAKWACKHGCGIVTAAGPPRVVPGGRFHASVYAHVLTSRLLDAIPFHRQADAMSRAGIPLSASTICDLFHDASKVLEPLYDVLVEQVRTSPLLHADETPQPVLSKGRSRRSYVWTFATQSLALFIHTKTRNGNVATELLAGTAGTFVADGYQGYNGAQRERSRLRAGCWAHARRKFVEAQEHEPDKVQWLLEQIAKMYQVEHEAQQRGIVGSDEHLQMRQRRTKPIVEQIHTWLVEQQGNARPRSPFGKAVAYALNQWAELQVFLDDPMVPPDNNHAERQLRRIALGRKNSLFVGSDLSGQDYAVNMSLVLSCRLNDIDPAAYLTDVLPRIAEAKTSELRDMLPDRWQPPAA